MLSLVKCSLHGLLFTHPSAAVCSSFYSCRERTLYAVECSKQELAIHSTTVIDSTDQPLISHSSVIPFTLRKSNDTTMSSVLPLSPMRSPLDPSSKPRQMIILSIILAAMLSRSTIVATPHAAVKEWYSERTRIRNERKRREAETPL